MNQDNVDPRRPACDLILSRAVEMMQGEVGAEVGMIIDRLLTFSAAQAVLNDGTERAAAVFRMIADKIEGGALDSVIRQVARN